MNNPVSLRARDGDPWQPLSGRLTPAPAAGVSPPAPPPSPCPTIPAPAVDAPLARCFVPAAPPRVEPTARRDARDVETQARLDSFREAMTGTYRTSDGKELRVSAPFQMTTPYDNQIDFMKEKHPDHEAQQRAAERRSQLTPEACNRVRSGRGTPEEIHALTQALLDGQPPGAITTPSGLRELMFEYRVGVDCAGYVQQAYLRATGQTRAQAGFRAFVNEDLSNLAHRGFQRVSSVSDVRPGDIVALESHDGGVGHRTIVYDQRVLGATGMRALLASGERAQVGFALGGPVRVLEVDSSWGCGYLVHVPARSGRPATDKLYGDPEQGGVQRETWLYNESTQQWASWDPRSGAFSTSDTPYNHRLDGFFRKAE